MDVRQVGRELGVRYVLEGGVRKAGNRLRINVQLVETATAANLWASRSDCVVEDIFDLQDSITERVVGIVEPRVQRSEKLIGQGESARTASTLTTSICARFPTHIRRCPKTPGSRLAFSMKPSSLTQPMPPLTRCSLGAMSGVSCAENSTRQKRESGLNHARAALDTGTDDAAALAIAGLVIRLLGKDNETAVSAVARALAFNPSCAMAFYVGTLIHALAGHSARKRSPARIARCGSALLMSWPIKPIWRGRVVAISEIAIR